MRAAERLLEIADISESDNVHYADWSIILYHARNVVRRLERQLESHGQTAARHRKLRSSLWQRGWVSLAGVPFLRPVITRAARRAGV